MKWLKIKKCLKIFSVVICSIFILSNKASALENTIFYDINTTKDKLLKYQEDYNNGRNIFNDIDLIINELNDNRTYDYFITAYYNSSFSVDFNIVIVPKNTELNTISSGSYAIKRYFYNLKLYNAPKVKYILLRYNINKTDYSLDFYNTNYSTFDDLINYLKNEKNNFTFNDAFYGELINGEYNYNGITDNIMTVNNMLYYSTLDIPFNNLDSSGNVYNLYINDILLKNNDNIPKLIDYLNIFSIPGYKKVVIPSDKQYAIISGVKTGRVYYKANSQISSYYDKSNREWGSIDWPKAITDLRKATFADNPNNPDLNSLYYFYDFDLSKVQDSQFILIEKYHEKICNLPDETIEECNNRYNYEQEIWIPDNADIYFSFIDVKPNENGGNDFDFDYKDPETGDINNSHTENDSSPDNEVGTFFDYLYKLLNNFQSGFIYISECFTNFFNELPFMIQAILGLAFTIGIVKFIIDLFK